MPDHVHSEPLLRSVMPFKAEPAELANLRNQVRSTLGRLGTDSVVREEAELVVTELATNVVKHVGGCVAATIVLESRETVLRVEVHDESPWVPEVDGVDLEAECGRGMQLLAGISMGWGTLLTASGKAVWCELALPPSEQCLRLQRAAAALESYQRRTGGRNMVAPYPLMAESVIDLIADLLHWLSAQGGDPDDILDRAQMHFEAEQEAA